MPSPSGNPADGGQLPTAGNATCDIYHPGNPDYPGPGGTPDVTGVVGYLHADYEKGLFAGDETTSSWDVQAKWTHWMLIDPGTAAQDGYSAGSFSDNAASRVWVPSQNNGTQFVVVFVERLNPGSTGDHKRLFLRRQPPTWPTNNL